MQINTQEAFKRVMGKINDLGEGFKMKKLWTNPNPTIAFDAQKIDLDLKEYDLILMTFKIYVSYTHKGTVAIFEKGDTAIVSGNTGSQGVNSGQLFAVNRIISEVSDTGITVDKAVYLPYSGSAATRNDCLLPYQIYGIKLNSNQKYLVPAYMEDYVIDYGTEGIWTYRKWSSGIAECWGTYNGTHGHYSTAFGGYGYNTGDINYPTNLFIDVPEQFVSVRIDGGFGIYAGDVNTSTASTTRIYAISSASGSQPLTAKIHAIGKWK